MKRSSLVRIVVTLGLLLGTPVALTVAATVPAMAASSLCTDTSTNWSPCETSPYTDHGWNSHYTSSYWGQASGHNCTNYVAYYEQTVNGQGGRPSWLKPGGNAKSWAGEAGTPGTGITVSTTPVVGAIADWYAYGWNYNDGHVGIVEKVSGSTIWVSWDSYSAGPYKWVAINSGDSNQKSPGWPDAFIDLGVTSGGGSTPPPPPPVSGNVANGSPISMAGHWYSGDTGQDFAYVEKVTNGSGQDTGFTVSIMEQTASGLVGHNEWTDNGNGLTFENTIFIPADANGDGLMDLYYVTSSDWNSPNGFSVGLMLNTGTGLSWAGTVWSPNNLALAKTKFVPGHFVAGTTGDGFAYITEASDGGFATGIMSPNQTTPGGAMTWNGDWWDSAGSSGVAFANTEFWGSDPDGNGLTDLYYATSNNWDTTGDFAVGLETNNGSGFSWGGVQWNPSNLALSNVRFIPGYWTGGSNEDLAYVSRSTTDSSFSVGVLTPHPGQLMDWQGDWWDQPASNGTYYQTVFMPADSSNDGSTDLYYAVSTNWNANGFAVGLMHNTHSALSWTGTAWAPTNIPLANTQLVPQS